MRQPVNIPVGARQYELVETYGYGWDKDGVSHELVVPRGFRYDGASVPRALWSLIGLRPDGLVRAAALLHDWIYRHGGRLPPGSYRRDDGEGGDWTREATDRLFARVMRESGVSKLKRRLAYLGVRVGGRRSWRKREKELN